jgi:hypothetical protein
MAVVDRLATDKPRSITSNPRPRLDTSDNASMPASTPAPVYPARPGSDVRSIKRGASVPPERIAKPVLMDPSSPLLHQVN